ncbi:hypothetical protein [Undibacterium sp. Ji22W]|uniref:hypothetical protein n=1 Tax=Undibacterium sp. Ji22W TaxID=3413038 RepID=UPI003BF08F45
MSKYVKLHSEQRSQELVDVANIAIDKYAGNIDELQKAFGMLFIGDFFGWKVLVVWHEKRTLRKYEEILGIKIREFFPEFGSMSYRATGYLAALDSGSFWKVVSGDISVQNRRQIIH